MQIRQILYTSQAQKQMSDDECAEILAVSRANNQRDGLTGFLIFIDNGTFIQALEGASGPLQATLDRIHKDHRHSGLSIILDHLVSEREFGDWEMGFRSVAFDMLGDVEGFRNMRNEREFQTMIADNAVVGRVMRSIYQAHERF